MIGRLKDRKAERQKSRKAERQKVRKSERQKDRKTETQKDRETTYFYCEAISKYNANLKQLFWTFGTNIISSMQIVKGNKVTNTITKTNIKTSFLVHKHPLKLSAYIEVKLKLF
jgi:hypothetical protein